jgi:hypothetical protein
MAAATRRRLVVRWHGEAQQEGGALLPAALDWRSTGEEGVWADATFDGAGKPVWTRPLGVWPVAIDDPANETGVVCAPVLQDPNPRVGADLEDVFRFEMLARGRAPLVIVQSLSHDTLHPASLYKQAAVAPIAHAQYRALFRSTPRLHSAICAHALRLNMSIEARWVGLQIRRSASRREAQLTRQWRPNATLQREAALRPAEREGVKRAALCALRAANATHAAAVYVTSNSLRVRRVAAKLLGGRARWTKEAKFGHHVGPAFGYVPALVEFALLSASASIVGSAGSMFALEAANAGNVSAIVRDWGLYGTVSTKLRRSTVQGHCDDTPRAPTASVFVSHGACA